MIGTYIHDTKEKAVAVPALPGLLPSQEEDAKALADYGTFCLFNKPGTGKTLTALAAWLEVSKREGRRQRLAIIVPPIAVRNWVEWTLAISPSDWVQVITTGKTPLDDRAQVLIVPYSLFSTDKHRGGRVTISERVRIFKPEIIIFDESHYLASSEANRTRAILGVKSNTGRPQQPGICQGVKYIWALTGTPIRRYPDDLWALFSVMFPDLLKELGVYKKYQWDAKFCVAEKWRVNGRTISKTSGAKNTELLNRIIFKTDPPLAVQRDHVANLPSLRFHSISVDYSKTKELEKITEQAKQVRSFGDEAELNPHIAKCWAMLGAEKAGKVAEYIEQETDATGVLVLAWHREVIKILSDSLGFPIIDGSTSQADRILLVEKFNEGLEKGIVGQIAALGVAINMQKGGRRVVFAERSWSPADNEQAYKRVWRMGQKHPVDVDICLTDHFIDDIQSTVLDQKERAAKEVLK